MSAPEDNNEVSIKLDPAAHFYGTKDGSGSGAGIEAFGLLVRIEVGEWDTVVSASPVDENAWCGTTLNQRLPNLVRVLNLMMGVQANASLDVVSGVR